MIGLILDPFLTWWINAEFAVQATPIGLALLIGVWINCLAQIPYAHLQAQGRPDLVAKCHLAELIPYLAILSLLVANWGAFGAAIAWSLRSTIDAGLLYAISTRRAAQSASKLVLPVFSMCAVLAILMLFPESLILKWTVGGVLVGLSSTHLVREMPDSLKSRILRRLQIGRAS